MAGRNAGRLQRARVALAVSGDRNVASAGDGASGRHNWRIRLAADGTGDPGHASFGTGSEAVSLRVDRTCGAGAHRCVAVFVRGNKNGGQSGIPAENVANPVGGCPFSRVSVDCVPGHAGWGRSRADAPAGKGCRPHFASIVDGGGGGRTLDRLYLNSENNLKAAALVGSNCSEMESQANVSRQGP